jgi:hypothetical protein
MLFRQFVLVALTDALIRTRLTHLKNEDGASMKLLFVAVVSFALGVAATLLVNPKYHAFAQGGVGGPISNGFEPIVPPLGSASPIPVVMPLAHIHFGHNTMVSHGAPLVVSLDGLEQTGNVYGGDAGVEFVYGGGAYKLEENTFVGPISLRLTGAAANTAELLEQFGFLAKNDPPTVTPVAVAPKEKNKPKIRKANIPIPFKGDISSQYDGSPQ